jgi:two-component system response regulator AtoC
MNTALAANAGQQGADRPLNVLVVDDEALIRWSLRRGLSLRGHRVSDAASAAEALRLMAAGASRFDAVVLDYRLPDRQDLSLLKQVLQSHPGAAVFMLTAYGERHMRDEAVALGARAVLDKPFRVADIVSFIESAVPPPGGC